MESPQIKFEDLAENTFFVKSLDVVKGEATLFKKTSAKLSNYVGAALNMEDEEFEEVNFNESVIKINFKKIESKEGLRTFGGFNSNLHFALKNQVELVLKGEAKHIVVYRKMGDNIAKRTCNGTEAKIGHDEAIVEVCD